MNDAPALPATNEPVAPAWMLRLASTSPAMLLAAAAPVALGVGVLAPDLGPLMLVGYLGVVGGVVSVLRPGIGLFLFVLMMYSRASEVLTTSLGVPSIAPLFTIWLLTGVIMHFGIGGLFHARPSGWQALAIYGLVLLASTLVASDPWAATYRVIDYARELVYIGLIILCVRQLSDLRIVVRALLLAGTIPALISIYQTLSGSTNSFLGFGRYSQAIVIPGEITEVARPAGMVGDPNFYALALIALIPLAFHRARWERSLFARQLTLLAGIVIAVASIMTYSRGGYVTLAVVVGCLVVAGFIRLKSLIIVVLVFVAILPILPESYSGRVSSIVDIPQSLLSQEPPERGEATDTSVSGRVSEVMSGVHMFLDHPILGVGTNNYPANYQEYARPMGVDRRTDRAPHSLYVEVAAETGIIGIVAFGFLVLSLFAALRRVWTTTNRGNELHDLALVVAISLLSILVASIFLHMAYPRFLMVFAGLTMAVASVQHWRVAPSSRLRFARLRPTHALLSPMQHHRMVLWGGVAGFSAAILASALILSLSINSGNLSLFQARSAAAILPPADHTSASGDGTPSATSTSDEGQPEDPDSSPTTGAGTETTPTEQPSSTPTVEPEPSVDIQIQKELLEQAMLPVAPSSAGDCVFVPETQHNICGEFASFFVSHGGHDIFGFPRTEQYIIGGTLIQYFERARFEWHAGTGGEAAYVLLTRLGAEQRHAELGREIDPPALPLDDDACLFEYQTGHNICDEFAYYWVASGGVLIFGYPITESFMQDGRHVQYFERARFELQPRVDGSLEMVVAPLGSEDIERILSQTSVDGSDSDG